MRRGAKLKCWCDGCDEEVVFIAHTGALGDKLTACPAHLSEAVREIVSRWEPTEEVFVGLYGETLLRALKRRGSEPGGGA